jgi:hypothetical protein
LLTSDRDLLDLMKSDTPEERAPEITFRKPIGSTPEKS